MNQEFPKPGSRWLNTRKQRTYIVIGVVSECENDNWEVLYRDPNWKQGEYRRRSLEEWYGINREGNPRFIEIKC